MSPLASKKHSASVPLVQKLAEEGDVAKLDSHARKVIPREARVHVFRCFQAGHERSRSEMADETGLDPTTVRDQIRALHGMGFIALTDDSERENKYTIVDNINPQLMLAIERRMQTVLAGETGNGTTGSRSVEVNYTVDEVHRDVLGLIDAGEEYETACKQSDFKKLWFEKGLLKQTIDQRKGGATREGLVDALIKLLKRRGIPFPSYEPLTPAPNKAKVAASSKKKMNTTKKKATKKKK